MITQIEGKLVEYSDGSVTLDVSGLFYEIWVPKSVLKAVEGRPVGESVRLVTYHYVQSDPSRSLPVLIGFSNKIEREFFEKFITVSGIGPKGALRALSIPISQIAQGIDEGDVKFLKTLPGVGEQHAREIVAKLQGKVGRFGLIRDTESGAHPVSRLDDFKDEALSVLLQLQYRRDEAKRMLDRALSNNPNMKTVEELLNEVYRQRSTEPAVD